MASDRASPLRAALAAAGAGTLFVGSWLVLGVPLVWSVGAGLAGYGALWFMTSGLGGRRGEEASFSQPFVDERLAKKTTEQGLGAAAALRETIGRLRRGDALAVKLGRLADLVEAIAKDVAADPKDAPAAAVFLSFQGQTAARIANIAIDLDARGASASQVAEARERVGGALDRLIVAHEKHLANLQEDNIEELQAELDVLEQSLNPDDRFGKLE